MLNDSVAKVLKTAMEETKKYRDSGVLEGQNVKCPTLYYVRRNVFYIVIRRINLILHVPRKKHILHCRKEKSPS